MRSLFIFDGDCGLCTRSVEFLKHVVQSDLDFLPYQMVNLRRYGLSIEDCSRAAQLVGGRGKEEGFGAFKVALGASPHVFSRIVFRLMSLRVIRWVGEPIYRKIATTRHVNLFSPQSVGCVLPQPEHNSPDSSDRNARWALARSHHRGRTLQVDPFLRSRSEVVGEWKAFWSQAQLVLCLWSVAGLLLVMRWVFGEIFGYGWGWQMFS